MKPSKLNLPLLCGRLVIIITAIITFSAAQSIRAVMMEECGPPDCVPLQPFTLTLTEISNTQLNLSYDGTGGSSSFMVTNTGSDTWTVTNLDPGTISFNNFTLNWTEPEEPLEVNQVSHSTQVMSDTLFVTSDLSGTFTALLNNTGIGPVGFEAGFVPINLVFNDLASTSEPTNGVSDRGGTLTLLALSLIGLAGLRRFRIPQLA